VAFGAKERHSDDHVTINTIIGDVTGKDVIVLDDEIARGSTIFELLERLRERDVTSVRVATTHGLFAGDCLARLSAQPDVLEIVCTNTVPLPARRRTPKVRVLSVASVLAEAMRRIHHGESVSALFN
jgi:ribose-phosphate pyrophosphokinase